MLIAKSKITCMLMASWETEEVKDLQAKNYTGN